MTEQTTSSNDPKITVFYTQDCIDSFTAAWVFHQYLRENYAFFTPDEHNAGTIKYIPVSYDPAHWPRSMPEDQLVFILNFTFQDRTVMASLVENNRQVIHLETKPSQKSTMIDYLTSRYSTDRYASIYDDQRAACVLAWQWAYGDKVMPYLLTRVQDRALWVFEYPETKAFCEALKKEYQTFKNWDAAMTQEGQKGLIKKGGKILTRMHNRAQELINLTHFSGKITLPDGQKQAIDWSRVGVKNDFAEQANMMLDNEYLTDVVGTYMYYNGKVEIRINSRDPAISAGELCQQYGGGGRPGVGGFIKELDDLRGRDDALGQIYSHVQALREKRKNT